MNDFMTWFQTGNASVVHAGHAPHSWRERCLGLLDRHGPTTLAFLESILRAADVRASRLKTNDPALSAELKVRT